MTCDITSQGVINCRTCDIPATHLAGGALRRVKVHDGDAWLFQRLPIVLKTNKFVDSHVVKMRLYILYSVYDPVFSYAGHGSLKAALWPPPRGPVLPMEPITNAVPIVS